MFNVRTRAAEGQSDNRHDKSSAVIPSLWICFPWETGFRVDLSIMWISYAGWAGRVDCWVILTLFSKTVYQLLKATLLLQQVKVKNSVVCGFCHLQDPFRVLQGFKEGVLGVGRSGTGSAGPQQLFKRSFHLPRVGKLHGHQFTVQSGVHSEALSKQRASSGWDCRNLRYLNDTEWKIQTCVWCHVKQYKNHTINTTLL